MSRRPLVLALAAPVLLLLAGCGVAAAPNAGPAVTVTPSAAAATTDPTATPAPAGAIRASSYLVQGALDKPGADGDWSAHYGFYTDSSKSVRCDLFVFSGDAPAASCTVLADFLDSTTYTVPGSIDTSCDQSSSAPADGTAMGMGGQIAKGAGWIGCQGTNSVSATIAHKTKVLPDGATLTVRFMKCTTHTGTAHCQFTDSTNHASITFGLNSASYTKS
ncbi:MAG: hypothetical protein QOI02_1495 [Actinomycetota bacterium]|nr:hypothetical protein [Actinomycetota bacterium]